MRNVDIACGLVKDFCARPKSQKDAVKKKFSGQLLVNGGSWFAVGLE
jgi:hypothetical protein